MKVSGELNAPISYPCWELNLDFSEVQPIASHYADWVTPAFLQEPL
jgi:hypothetical protein